MTVEDLIAAAFAADREGREHDAIRFYDQAYRLGVPAEHRRAFAVGYGSTLRNVGRADDAVGVLASALAEDPTYPAYAPFLALALARSGFCRTAQRRRRRREASIEAGQAHAAVATLLGSVLDLAPGGSLDGYERALAGYQAALLERATTR